MMFWIYGKDKWWNLVVLFFCVKFVEEEIGLNYNFSFLDDGFF